MRRFVLILMLLGMAALLGGCQHATDALAHAAVNLGDGATLRVARHDVLINVPTRPEARIDASGALRIGRAAIATTPAQQALLQRYYQQAQQVSASGVAVGAAGVALASSTLGDVAKAMAQGKSGQVDAEVHQADGVKQAARTLCAALGTLAGTQQALAAQLPAFVPYAVIHTDAAQHCSAGLSNTPQT